MGKLQKESYVDAALRMIAVYCGTPQMRLTFVADALRVSPFYLSRLMSQATRRSFPHHLHTVRIIRAVRLLNINEYSTKEVATAVGYQWTSELDRHCVSRTHLRPREFRPFTKENSNIQLSIWKG